MYARKYVDVIAYFTEDGTVKPLSIVWDNGCQYEIDRILDVRRASSTKAGGNGTRFTVNIQGRQRYLFLQSDNKWFVEKQMN